jgi:hypothetical protein
MFESTDVEEEGAAGPGLSSTRTPPRGRQRLTCKACGAPLWKERAHRAGAGPLAPRQRSAITVACQLGNSFRAALAHSAGPECPGDCGPQRSSVSALRSDCGSALVHALSFGEAASGSRIWVGSRNRRQARTWTIREELRPQRRQRWRISPTGALVVQLSGYGLGSARNARQTARCISRLPSQLSAKFRTSLRPRLLTVPQK